MARVHIAVTCPGTRVGVDVALAGAPVAVGIFPVAVALVVVRSITGVNVAGGVALGGRVGARVGEATATGRVGVSVIGTTVGVAEG